jgi:hypothetical protein
MPSPSFCMSSRTQSLARSNYVRDNKNIRYIMSYAPGFQPVARDPSELPYATTSSKITLADLPLPSSDLLDQAKQFLKPILGEPVWNHSHRSFLFGKRRRSTSSRQTLADVFFSQARRSPRGNSGTTSTMTPNRSSLHACSTISVAFPRT